MVRNFLLVTAYGLLAACMQPAETPSHNKAATANFTAENVLMLAKCGGYLEATGNEKQGQALAYRATELAPSRGIDTAAVAAQKSDGEKLAAAVAGSPEGNKLSDSCNGLYRNT